MSTITFSSTKVARLFAIILFGGALLAVLLNTEAAGQITYDSTQGIYHVEYVGQDDSTHNTALLTGNRARPIISASVVDSVGVFRYSYIVANDIDALAGLGSWWIRTPRPDSVLVPDVAEWSTFPYIESAVKTRWLQSGHTGFDIGAGDSLGGFVIVHPGLPAIREGAGHAFHHISFDDEGPIDSLAGILDSLMVATAEVRLATLAPSDTSFPDDLFELIDTLATYSSRAYDLGWIDSTPVRDKIETALEELSDDFAAEDSAHAAGLIRRTLDYVESQKDSTLSSEAYALFKYNLEYALDFLPDILTLRLFAGGPYNFNTGQMNTDIDEVIPLTDTVFADSLIWNYSSNKEYSSVPAHTIDWALVVLQDTGWTTVNRSTGLLDKYGYVSVPVDTSLTAQYRAIVDLRNHAAIATDSADYFTSGYAEYDFTTGRAHRDGAGVAQQRQIVSGADTVYAMFAGDATADCQINASDFNVYLTDTKAVRTGYFQSDFNVDATSSALDYNLWLVNTKAVAKSAGKACLTGKGFSRAPYTGQGSESASKTSTAQGIDTRYYITGDANQFSGSLNATINVRTWEWTDTLGSFVFDVYFNSDQLYYAWPLNHQVLLDAGYSLEIAESANEYGSFIRVQAYTHYPDTVTHQIHGYDFLPIQVRLRFYENDGTVTSHDVAFNRATLSVAVTEDGKIVEKEEVNPVYVDLYTY